MLLLAMLLAAAPPAKVAELARKDLATKLAVDEAKIETVSQKETVWPDGSLGCPQPGMNYIQMQVPGWIFEFRYNGKKYTYHADSRRVVHCEQGSGTPLPSR
jgi:hypothetical protein